ncbi:MAG: putative T4-like protein proximal tail fiber [Candidatus Nomurabacteria bacterium GW2011_GWF2_36_126]|nr:MAG: putative T4-like protein proximal tail fiber [Candidatus Nomurabacteria bacterium GW2011_GWF2_36_126]
MNNFRSSKIYLVKLLLMLYLVLFFGFYTNAFAVSDTQTNTEINTQELNTPYSFRQLTSPTFDKYKEFIDQIGNKVKEFINLSDSKPKVSTVVATQPKVLKINKKVEAKNKIETKDKVEANTKLLPTQILTPTKVVERIIERPTTIFINQTDPSIIVRLQNLERSNSNNASFNSLQVDRIYDSVNKNISNNSNDITESGTLNSPTFTGTTTITGNTINLSGTNPLIDGTNASGTLSINTTTNRPVTFGSGVVTIPNLNASVVGTITKANNLTGGNSTTLLGSLPYQSDTDTSTLLAPNTTTTKNFLSMTGTGTNGAVPAWSTVTATDVGLGNVTNESKATMFTSPTFTGTVAGFTMGGNIALGANTFTTSNTGLVTNLNADLLDGQHGSYYATASSLGSYVPYTGANANLNLGTYNITTSAINNLPLSQDNTDFNVKVGQDAGLNIVTGAQYNTFLGYQAGTSGSGTSTNAADANTAVGYHSLYSNTTGYRNTANGYNSLYSNTTGYYNTANGGKSLYSNTTGSSNTAIGDCALCTNTTGSNNTAIGDGAGYSGTGVFIQNTLIGAETGYNGSTPYSYNTAVGYRAGYNLFGNSNVMFGMFAGAYELGSNSFYVDNQDRANTAGDKAGALLYGMFNSTPSLQTLTINASTTIAQNLNVLGAGNNYFVGNLGIGTSSPTAALHLKAGTATAGTAPLKFTSGTLLTTPEAGAVEFLTDAYYGTITTGGARKTFAFLESPVFTTNITTPLILGGSATTSDLTLQTTSGVGATGADMHFLVGNNGATEAMTILNDGKVGIGTTTPQQKLHIFGDISDDTDVLRIQGSSASYFTDIGVSHYKSYRAPSTNGGLNFGLDSSDGTGWTGSGGYISFSTNNATGGYNEKVRIDMNGSVGIGTTAPGSKLHVQNTLGTPQKLLILDSDSATSTDETVGSQIAGIRESTGGTSYLSFSNYLNGTGIVERMRINGSGSVGIGTTNPASLFHLEGSIPVLTIKDSRSGSSWIHNDILGQIDFNTSDSTGIGAHSVGFIKAINDDSASGYPASPRVSLSFGTGNYNTVSTERMRIDYSGNVGIGTTSPLGKLDVIGNMRITRPGFENNTYQQIEVTDVTTTFNGQDSDGYMTYNFNSNGATNLRINNLGNVGIGTTTPTGKLDIQGLAVNDLPTYSAEFLLDTGWTSTDWTGDFATGWTHTVGNTSVLSHDKVAVNATKYQIAYTVTGRTAGSFTIGFGGQSASSLTATGAWGPTTTSTASLTITPTTDFDGTIVISIKSLTAVSTPLVNLKSSDGTARIEMRANTASGNTFIGVGAGRYNTTGYQNTANGLNSFLANTTGIYNTANGAYSLTTNTTGYYNTAYGHSSLYSNTTGFYNTANGYASLYSNTTGNYNTSNGERSLYSNTTGSNNTANGIESLYSNTTGDSNTADGYGSLNLNTTGSSNTALGYRSGRYIADGTTANTTSDYGVYIGRDTKAGADNNQNEIVIGYNAVGNGSNTATIGTGNVLYVGGASVVGTVARFTSSTGYCDISPLTTALVCSSDINLKKNITTLEDIEFILKTIPDMNGKSTLEKLTYLTPVNYNWNSESDTDARHIGFIAQEMEQIFPSLVFTDPKVDPITGLNLKSISYTNLIPYTIEAIKEMNLKITSIENIDINTSFISNLKGWLASATNGIEIIFAKIMKSDRVETKEFCTSDNECLNEDQLRIMIQEFKNTHTQIPEPQTIPDPEPTPDPVVTPDTTVTTDTEVEDTTTEDTTPPTSSEPVAPEPVVVPEPEAVEVSPTVAPETPVALSNTEE